MRNHRPLSISFAATSMLAFSLGAPDGCQAPPNVGVESAQLTPTSVDGDQSTQSSPVVVTRDNPNLGGAFDITVSGVSSTASGPFSYDGRWTNLAGLARVSEYRANGTAYNAWFGPVLPRAGSYTSPTVMGWNSRFAQLVHENTFSANVDVNAGGQAIHSNRSLWMRLSDDVSLVPVVVVSWRVPGRPFVDHSAMARAAFDFIPTYAPPDMAPTHTLPELRQPTTTRPAPTS